jgi:hypothetical protein
MGKSRTKKIKEAAMSQTTNSAINFDLSHINMWNGGDAIGFDLATTQYETSGLPISTD